jgi:pentatricopeptide repeat protein
MKVNIQLLFLLALFISCKNDVDKNAIPITSYEDEVEIKKWDSIYNNFQDYQVQLYGKYKKDPKYVISKIDSLLREYKTDKNITADLHYFKAEVLYNSGDYIKSIRELGFENTRETEVALICNYVKTKDFKKAKQILDNVSKNDLSFDDFIYANYYEVVNEKDQALKIYESIKNDESLNRFYFYKLSVDRIAELKKSKSLLNSIYFPTGNPSFKKNITNGI